uniref:Uncharacterized protein n=1 Tax=Panagrolaimus sp. JU765 TaxID=591449 RepID=A0AC34R444_9BILA
MTRELNILNFRNQIAFNAILDHFPNLTSFYYKTWDLTLSNLWEEQLAEHFKFPQSNRIQRNFGSFSKFNIVLLQNLGFDSVKFVGRTIVKLETIR